MVNLNQMVAIVDDDESIGRAIQRLLRGNGMKAETFSRSEQFLDRLLSTASYRPACAVVDFQMPGIDGLELLRRVTPTRVPVILITASDNLAVREIALASGAAGYLRKPFHEASLIKAVKTALVATPITMERLTPE